MGACAGLRAHAAAAAPRFGDGVLRLDRDLHLLFEHLLRRLSLIDLSQGLVEDFGQRLALDALHAADALLDATVGMDDELQLLKKHTPTHANTEGHAQPQSTRDAPLIAEGAHAFNWRPTAPPSP